MSKAERPTQQLRNHSAHRAEALFPSQLRSPGDNDRKGPSHSWPPLQGDTAPGYNVPLTAVAGPPCSAPHKAVTQPPSLEPLDLSPPGGTAQPPPALAQHAELPPLQRTTKVY